ncbi:MAG TPA: phage holin family protein [Burkholderiales bacterium]|jgi:uncharacterized membrane protein YqjE|nr:phage holin family protein [Burkholderiales bacterium]
MLASLRELGRTALALAVTRGRLAANEIEEQAVRAAEILVWAVLALLLLGVTVVFVAVLVVLLFWDENRLLATGLVALVLALGCAGAAWLAVLRMRERPPLLAQTFAELERDHDALTRM